MRYKLTAVEQETTLLFCRDDKSVTVFTSDRLEMARFDRLCEQYPGVYQLAWVDETEMADGLPGGKRYTFPRRYLRFGRPATARQIEHARENLARMDRARV